MLCKRFRLYLNLTICNKYPSDSNQYLNLRTTDLKCLQAYLRDIVDLVSDHCNKASIHLKEIHTFFCCFLETIQLYVHHTVVY